jgi:hypothetical protein
MPDLPIACTLTSDDLTARLALIEALSADGLLDRTPTDAGLRVRLRDTPDVEQRTRALVAAESTCCPFLDFDLRREGGDLLLDITGPADARPVIELFFATPPSVDDTSSSGAAPIAAALLLSSEAQASGVARPRRRTSERGRG